MTMPTSPVFDNGSHEPISELNGGRSKGCWGGWGKKRMNMALHTIDLIIQRTFAGAAKAARFKHLSVKSTPYVNYGFSNIFLVFFVVFLREV